MRHLTAFRVIHHDPVAGECESHHAIEFHVRLLVRRHGRHQVGLSLHHVALRLQHQKIRRRSYPEFLLFGFQRLLREVTPSLRGFYARAVLLSIELRVVHFDPHLVFKLLQSGLRLAQLEFRARLVGLRRPIADRYRDIQTDGIGREVFAERCIKRVAVSAQKGRSPGSRPTSTSQPSTTSAAKSRSDRAERVLCSRDTRAAVASE